MLQSRCFLSVHWGHKKKVARFQLTATLRHWFSQCDARVSPSGGSMICVFQMTIATVFLTRKLVSSSRRPN